MRTTIDAAGRIVVPKALRDAMGLTAGRQVDVVFTDGRLEIEIAPAEVEIEMGDDGLPRAVHKGDVPPLPDEIVRATIEATRR
jgi:AbrB family looped-hinge helix DNA binding protein